jgi:hypothetical protein
MGFAIGIGSRHPINISLQDEVDNITLSFKTCQMKRKVS